MMQTKEIVDTIYAEYSAIQSNAHPAVLYPTIRTLKKEAYHLRYEKGQLHLLAESAVAAAFGAAQAFIGVESGHWPDMMGSKEAKFPLRPLILRGGQTIFVHKGSCTLPIGLDQQEVAAYALSRGFNALIFRLSTAAFSSDSSFSIKDWLQRWKELGIQPIVELNISLSGCPLEKGVRSQFLKEWRDLSTKEFPAFIFWESRLGCPEYEKGKAYEEGTTLDLLLAELELVEEAFSSLGGVVFSFPLTKVSYFSKYAHWLKWMTLMASPQTTIAFPVDIQGKLNPFFELLRFQQERVETPLLPFLSLCDKERGGGGWPIVIDEELANCMHYMERHAFAGLALEIPTKPSPASFLDWNVWIGGAIQWGMGSAKELATTWCRAYFPYLENEWRGGDFDRIRRLANDLYTLSQPLEKEEGKAQTEALFATLDLLQAKCMKKGNLKKIIDPFLVDARRIAVLFGERYFPAAKAQPLYPDQQGVWTNCVKKGDHYEIVMKDSYAL